LEPHHEVSETFADSIGLTLFDGHTLKLEFVAARIEEPNQPSTQPIGTRHVVARMVLSVNCAVDLINQMQRVGAQLAQAGLVKAEQPTTGAKPIEQTLANLARTQPTGR
jgi:hypothetical protein